MELWRNPWGERPVPLFSQVENFGFYMITCRGLVSGAEVGQDRLFSMINSQIGPQPFFFLLLLLDIFWF